MKTMITKITKVAILLVCAWMLVAGITTAQERETFVPESLKPWVEWVKQRHPEWKCARSRGANICVWPGRAKFEVRADGAHFSLAVDVSKEEIVPLPTSATLSPFNITVTDLDDRSMHPALVGEHGKLGIKLSPGEYLVEGDFKWGAIPPELPVPAIYGWVEVVFVEGVPARAIRRTEQGITFESAQSTEVIDSLALQVFRRLSDGSPVRLETRIRFRVAGKARPLDLGVIIPQNFQAVDVSANLPFHLGSEGKLAVQLVGGEFEVNILAVAQQPLTEIQSRKASFDKWPEEIWSWVPDSKLRSVQIDGAPTIQPDLTDLPEGWRDEATYVVGPDTVLTLKEIRRGEENKALNQLSLQREFWPNFDGSGFIVRDVLQGEFLERSRVNALPETKLGRASINSVPTIVTADPKSKLAGVELRATNLTLEGISELGESRTVSSTGWDVTVNTVGMTLNLPPMWKLLHVNGGRAFSSWVESWSLLHIFFGIVLIVAAKLLLGITVASLLGCALVLNHQEFLAPRMLIVHLLILVAWSLLVKENQGFWGKLCRGLLVITVVAWGLQALAFIKLQVTQMLFPQLEAGTRYWTALQLLMAQIESSLLAWPFLLSIVALVIIGVRFLRHATGAGNFILRTLVVAIGGCVGLIVFGGLWASIMFSTGDQYAQRSQMPTAPGEYNDTRIMQRSNRVAELFDMSVAKDADVGGAAAPEPEQFSYTDKALVSGPALPTWRWRQHVIQIDGPVDSSKQVSFILLSAGMNRLLSALRVFLMLALVWIVWRRLGFVVRIPNVGHTATIACLLLLCNFGCLPTAYADFPSATLLKELEETLATKRCQRTVCAVIERGALTLDGRTYTLTLTASSDGAGAVALPGPMEVLMPQTVSIDGAESFALRRIEGNVLEVRVPPGRSVIEVKGIIPEQIAFSIQFQDKPLFLTVAAQDWIVEGLSPSGVIIDSLRITKRSQKESDTSNPNLGQTSSATLTPWVIVHREVTIAEQIEVTTQVDRIGGVSNPARVRIPLLAGESVTAGEITVEGNDGLLNFDPGVNTLHYRGTLPSKSEILLEARKMPMVSEEWRVRCSSVVACAPHGLTPTATVIDGSRIFFWQPFPGEKTTLELVSIKAFSGNHLTIDSVVHEVRWGGGLLEGTLTTDLRVTQPSAFTLTIPEGAVVTGVLVDNRSDGHTVAGQAVSVLLTPRPHTVILAYRVAHEAEFKDHAPQIGFNHAVHNATLRLQPKEDRWLLWTANADWGPNVVFWSKLLVLAAICVALQWIGLLPVNILGAILLGIGLTTLPMVWTAIPLAWLGMLKLAPYLKQALLGYHRVFKVSLMVVVTIAGILAFYRIVETGLVLDPPMLVVGNRSSAANLQWFYDHVGQTLPDVWFLSLPIWVWRAFAIVWSTWLVVSFVGWIKQTIRLIREV
jgi:hypothetical protein